MHRTIILILLGVLSIAPAQAALKVFTCEPEWAALVQELGGAQVTVASATTALQDPHHIEARPSLIAKTRQADLLVCTGAGLEAGWLPPLLRTAGNPKVQPGQPGYFEAASAAALLEARARADRAEGDVHPQGNPHLHLDARNIARVAEQLATRLKQLDPANAAHYAARHADFARRWQTALARWEREAAPLKGMPVVYHHRSWVYLAHWLGLKEIGVLEPKPGLPPTAAHLTQLLTQLGKASLHKNNHSEAQPARAIIRSAYEDGRADAWLAERARIPALVLPYTVGAEGADDLLKLFDITIARLKEVAR
ncbi:MAG TPA: zinc ABC transporter substrate-binding protein [Acidiferrobacterales bacterium]|nr:zinc ABC transporter substrate-binding protein [Acidiferrobacterales bacterium]